MELRFRRNHPTNRWGSLPIFLVAGIVSTLLSGNAGLAQEGSVSFSRQPSWDAREPSATFVLRSEQEQRAKRYDERSFSSDDGTPVSLTDSSFQTSESAVLQQPYHSIDHAFHRDTASRFEPAHSALIPQSTYSFDSREWVEHFPTALRSERDTFSSDQVTPTNFWAPGAETASPAPKVAIGARVAETDVSKQIDLSPNPAYARHLRYTDVCGVVVVQSNFPLTEIETLLHEIELLQRDLNQYMAIPAPKEKIELCLFKDEASYIRFLKDVFPKAPLDRRALYVKEKGKPGVLLVQRTKDFEVDLRHEMTHAVIHASIANVPIWLDEGLAKYFESPPEERAANHPYLKQIRWNVKFGAVPSLARLERLEFIGEMGSREYRDSWSWVHFLIHHSPQSHRLLAGYLQLLASQPEQSDNPRRGSKTETPPISLYITDVVKEPKEKYLEHFRTWAVEAKDDE